MFPGFKLECVASGLDLPVNLAFVPNPGENPESPLVYIAELYGTVKVITNDHVMHTYAKNLLNYEPDYKFPGTGESGLIGICVDPASGDLCLSMLYEEPGSGVKAKLVRTSSRDGITMDSMTTLIDNIPSVRAAHQIQTVTIGPDGKLYVNVGDGMLHPEVAQDEQELRGKILRMNTDGSIPEDNPYPGSYVFAKGVRNPFGATWRKSDNALYITDNGPEVDDRIAKIEAGGNYGWPETMRKDSLFWWHYPQAPTALAFMQGGQFPSEYDDELFVALFGSASVLGPAIKGKKIVKLRIDDQGVRSYDEFVKYIGNGPASPCGLTFCRDGLYFTDLHGEPGESGPGPAGHIFRVSPAKPVKAGAVPYTEENQNLCICKNCPSYNLCMQSKMQILFCSHGASECGVERKGCLCGECPVTSKYRLSGLYYCE